MNERRPRPGQAGGMEAREAAEWFVIIHSEDEPSPETLHAWLRWLDQSEANRKAFESIAHTWHGMPGSVTSSMPGAEELEADDYDGDLPVSEWLARDQDPPGGHPGRIPGRPRSWRRASPWLVAASAAAVAMGLLVMSKAPVPSGSHADSFATRAGEQIEITLADGSHVWLGPKSVLDVAFSRSRRDMRLSAGEAFFSVKKDPSRPFVVGSASGDITAVGTAFNVRALNDHVTVSVSEGVVTVAPQEPASIDRHPTVRVASGQQVTFSADEAQGDLFVTQSASPGERSRWRDGILIYRDEPLRDVVMDIARYTSKEFTISDASIGDLRYTGVVYQDAVDEWASALAESFPVTVSTDGNRKTIRAR